MVKGLSRKIIVVKSPDPKIFEQAIFIVRDEYLHSQGIDQKELMRQANEAASEIEKAADSNAIIIFGAAIKEEIKDEIYITVIATGFENRDQGLMTGPVIAEVPVEVKEETVEAVEEPEKNTSTIVSDSSFKIPDFLTQK